MRSGERSRTDNLRLDPHEVPYAYGADVTCARTARTWVARAWRQRSSPAQSQHAPVKIDRRASGIAEDRSSCRRRRAVSGGRVELANWIRLQVESRKVPTGSTEAPLTRHDEPITLWRHGHGGHAAFFDRNAIASRS